MSSKEQIKYFKKTILPLLLALGALERAMVVKKLSEILKVPTRAINEEIQIVTEQDSTKKKQSDILTQIALANMLFHDDLEEPYTLIEYSGHNHIMKIGHGRDFTRHISSEYYKQTGVAPSTESIKQAINIAEAKALFEGKKYKLFSRVANSESAFWYDLADEKNRAVKITADGWQIIDKPPILFIRHKNQEKQVEPAQDGDVWKLADFININDNGLKLLIVYLISTLIPNIPHPIAVFHGGKGAAKSTTMQFIRRLIDPSKREFFAFMPKDLNELTQQLYANYLPCYDNLSSVSQMQSNLLCGSTMGSGNSKRKLHTDSEDVIMNFYCCPVLNGINLVATSTDLLDRCIVFELERIKEENRREALEVFNAFENARAAIFAGFLDVLSSAMKLHPIIKLKGLPRMADFTRWGYAIAEIIGIGGDNFISLYSQNRNMINLMVIEENPVAAAIMEFMCDRKEFSGTMTELYKELSKLTRKLAIDTKFNDWPKSPSALSRKLTTIKSNLSDIGIIYCNHSRNAQGSQITINKFF